MQYHLDIDEKIIYKHLFGSNHNKQTLFNRSTELVLTNKRLIKLYVNKSRVKIAKQRELSQIKNISQFNNYILNIAILAVGGILSLVGLYLLLKNQLTNDSNVIGILSTIVGLGSILFGCLKKSSNFIVIESFHKGACPQNRRMYIPLSASDLDKDIATIADELLTSICDTRKQN